MPCAPVLGVVATMVALVLGTATATVPTPLYPIYARELGLDGVGVTGTFALFAAGAVIGLAIAARAADVLTRRRAFAVAVSVQAVAALVLGLDLGLTGLVVGRIVTGLGAGVLAASGTAFVIELSQHLPGAARVRRVAPALAFGGLGVGPLLALAAAERDLAAIHATFLALAVTLVLLLLVSVRLLPRGAGRAVAAPGGGGALPAASGFGAFAAFSATGLFGSVTTILLADLGITSVWPAAALAATVFLAGAAGVVLLAPHAPLWLGAGILTSGLLGVAVAVVADALVLFAIAALLAGCGSGVLFARSLARALAAAPLAAFRATSLVFAWAYAGLALPVLGAGVLLRLFGTGPAVGALAAVAAAVAAAAVVLDRATPPDATRP